MRKIISLLFFMTFNMYCSEDIIALLSPDSWKEYKDLRLAMLLEAPEAYGAIYQEEACYPDEQWRDYLIEAAMEKRTIILFYQSDNHVVGMAGAKIGLTPKTSHKATLFSIYVRPNYRNRGIAKQIIISIINKLKEKDVVKKIELLVNTRQEVAVSLYESLGFSVEGLLRNYWCFNGQCSDVYSLGMLL